MKRANICVIRFHDMKRFWCNSVTFVGEGVKVFEEGLSRSKVVTGLGKVKVEQGRRTFPLSLC